MNRAAASAGIIRHGLDTGAHGKGIGREEAPPPNPTDRYRWRAPASAGILKALATPGSGVNRGLTQTLEFAEELTRRNEQLAHLIEELPAENNEDATAAFKALRQNIALIKKLYAHLGT